MKVLIGTMSVCLGCYFAAYSGRLIILRSAGHTSLFKLLDEVTGYLPYLSVAILLLVGILAVLKNVTGQQRAIVKVPLMLLIAVIPFAVHTAMYSLTYSAGPAAPPKMLGPLPISEWLIFLVGFGLIAIGLFLLLRTRNVSTVPRHAC